MSRRTMRRVLLVFAVLALLASACAEDSETAGEATPGDTAATAGGGAGGSEAAGGAGDESEAAGSEAAGSEAAGSEAAGSEAAAGGSEAAGDAAAGDAEEGPIRIGVVLDITGPGANLGGPERDTIQLLAEELNAEGGINGREIEVDIRDNQSREDEAATQLNSLVQEGVDIIIGASRTGTSLAMRPIADQAQIPMISLAANQAIVDGSDWVFKTAQNDRVVIQRLLDWMEAQGYENLGLMRDASAFGEGVAELFQEESGNPDIVAVEERFATDATDFTAQLVNLRAADADVNVIWGIPPAAATATIAYRDLGIETPLLHSHGIGNPVFLEIAGPAANGVVFPIGRLLVADELPPDDPQKVVIDEFVAAYEERYGAPPSTFAGHAWDGWTLAIDALREAGTDPEALREYLETAELVGMSGVFKMTPEDHSGLGPDALIFAEIEDGDWTLADEQPEPST